MLVLSRKKNEKVMIAGGSVVVQVLEIKGDRVRLGIVAPDNIDVHREEVFNAIMEAETHEDAS